jgi:plasmid stabilization system protein ParE
MAYEVEAEQKQCHRITIGPFPYNIIYKIIGSKVLVLAVFHQSRNTEELLKRRK